MGVFSLNQGKKQFNMDMMKLVQEYKILRLP